MAMKPGQYVEQMDIIDYPTRVKVDRESASTMVLVGDNAPWEWAVIQRVVGGWSCLAVGTMDGAANESETADKIIEEYGDGFAHLSRDQFKMERPDGELIHLLRPGGGNDTYCGSTAANPYTYTRSAGRYQQHHIACTDAFRAENYGRCPLMEG